MSIARAIRKRPKLCRVFFSKNKTEMNPPIRPAIKGMQRCFYSSTHLLKAQSSPLKMRTKLPTKRPKFLASLLVSILKRWVGLLKIFLMPNTADSPDLMRQLNSAILELSLSIDSMQPLLCLHEGVLEMGNCRSCKIWVSLVGLSTSASCKDASGSGRGTSGCSLLRAMTSYVEIIKGNIYQLIAMESISQ